MNYKILLENEDITDLVAIPFDIQVTLDESLDQAQIKLQNTDIKDPIQPLKELNIQILDKNNNVEKVYYFYTSNDRVTDNLQTNTFAHDLQLIEQTKWLERFTNIIKTNTKSLIKDYLSNPQEVNIVKTVQGKYEDDFFSDIYMTPIKPKTIMTLSPDEFIALVDPSISEIKYDKTNVRVFENDKKIASSGGFLGALVTFKSNKEYKFEYEYIGGVVTVLYTFSIFCVNDTSQLKEKTITDVINNLLSTFETLTKSQTPRFVFNKQQEEEYSKIIAPEFSLNGTLFECLQQIGNYIHAIPRLQNSVISFDKLGSNNKTEKDLEQFISQTKTFTIDQFATSLDSYIDNLINTDVIQEGGLVEPSFTTLKTVRTDIGNVQLTEDNIFIETTEPIEQIVKVECGFISDNTKVGDITNYVYSKTEYDGQLSSISDVYPLSKGYAIYYSQGQKNIYGLNFKLPDAINPIFKHYAIINIIKRITGKQISDSDIINLQFKVTYIPNVNGRVKQTKVELNNLSKSSTITFNQNSPKVSSKHYGEAIKGALAKLGNPEIIKSYIFSDINDLPQVGELYNNDYYISLIKCEFYNDFYKCDIALSKNYNRKDQYTSLNSNIRFYEISEQMTQDRQVYYEDACIIGQDIEYNEEVEKPLITEDGLLLFAENLRITGEDPYITKSIQNANIKTYDKNNDVINEFNLPVTAISMGNSILMHYEFLDNFTAGTKRTTKKSTELQYQQSYTDIFGEVEYIEFGLGEINFSNPIRTYEEAIKYGNSLPIADYEGIKYKNYFESKDDTALLIKKDNREVISINYQLNFISNDNIILGEELPKSNWFITGGKPEYKLYILQDLIPKFTSEIDLTNAIDLGGLKILEQPNSETKMQLKIKNKSANEIGNNSGKSWAICNKNKLVFGKNQNIEPNKELVLPFITFKHII